MTRKRTILVASFDPHLADVRKHVLEAAGFEVIPARDVLTVRAVCKKKKIDLLLIGHSLPPAEKRRVRGEAREVCNTRILGLYEHDEPELIDSRHFSHQSHSPDDFLDSVQRILRTSKA